jgi:hypothetical protein
MLWNARPPPKAKARPGEHYDRLCVVFNGPFSDRRQRFLEAHAVAVVQVDAEGVLRPIGKLAQELIQKTNVFGVASSKATKQVPLKHK